MYYDYTFATDFSMSNGLVLADTPAAAVKVVRDMPEYKGLRNMTITLQADNKRYVYTYVDGKRISSKTPRCVWVHIDPADAEWDTSKSYTNADHEARCIGHLRADFGRNGEEFWSSWFDHNPALKTRVFRDELQNVVNDERKRGHILHDFKTMTAFGHGQPKLNDGSFLLKTSTAKFDYLLRCIPRRGDYNIYLYCYVRSDS